MANKNVTKSAEEASDLERFYAEVSEIIARNHPVSEGFMLLKVEDPAALVDEQADDDGGVGPEAMGGPAPSSGKKCVLWAINPKTGKKKCIKWK